MRPQEPSEDDVYTYMGDIPDELTKCAAAQHAFRAHTWTAWNARGNEVRSVRNAVAIDVTKQCRTCGLQKHFTMTVRRGRPVGRSDITYSNRNPLITSPAGISRTGISVRREMSLVAEYDEILSEPVNITSAKQRRTERNRGAA